jgi:hypothetical protein
MSITNLTWQKVDQVASELGATEFARAKWRQRQVPHDWRIRIFERLTDDGENVRFSDFDALESTASKAA